MGKSHFTFILYHFLPFAVAPVAFLPLPYSRRSDVALRIESSSPGMTSSPIFAAAKVKRPASLSDAPVQKISFWSTMIKRSLFNVANVEVLPISMLMVAISFIPPPSLKIGIDDWQHSHTGNISANAHPAGLSRSTDKRQFDFHSDAYYTDFMPILYHFSRITGVSF